MWRSGNESSRNRSTSRMCKRCSNLPSSVGVLNRTNIAVELHWVLPQRPDYFLAMVGRGHALGRHTAVHAAVFCSCTRHGKLVYN